MATPATSSRQAKLAQSLAELLAEPGADQREPGYDLSNWELLEPDSVRYKPTKTVVRFALTTKQERFKENIRANIRSRDVDMVDLVEMCTEVIDLTRSLFNGWTDKVHDFFEDKDVIPDVIPEIAETADVPWTPWTPSWEPASVVIGALKAHTEAAAGEEVIEISDDDDEDDEEISRKRCRSSSPETRRVQVKTETETANETANEMEADEDETETETVTEDVEVDVPNTNTNTEVDVPNTDSRALVVASSQPKVPKVPNVLKEVIRLMSLPATFQDIVTTLTPGKGDGVKRWDDRASAFRSLAQAAALRRFAYVNAAKLQQVHFLVKEETRVLMLPYFLFASGVKAMDNMFSNVAKLLDVLQYTSKYGTLFEQSMTFLDGDVLKWWNEERGRGDKDAYTCQSEDSDDSEEEWVAKMEAAELAAEDLEVDKKDEIDRHLCFAIINALADDEELPLELRKLSSKLRTTIRNALTMTALITVSQEDPAARSFFAGVKASLAARHPAVAALLPPLAIE